MSRDLPAKPPLRGRAIGPRTAQHADPVPQGGWIDPRSLEPGAIRHGQCGKWWTGASNGHCGKCHRVFSRGAFDKHQRIKSGVITCSVAGLSPHPYPWGLLWTLPGGYWPAREQGEKE